MSRPLKSAVSVMTLVALIGGACGRSDGGPQATELQRLKSGTLDVGLLSPHQGLSHGKDTFILEFRSSSNGSLVDVGDVRGSATMPMPGMPMMGSIDVTRTSVAGRYSAVGDFAMAGTWRMTVQWQGSSGQGSVTFSTPVQ